MDINKAKEIVVMAGKKLVESGLIARTWGNVSCRVSDTQFVITPSGRAYETLTPEEIVLVNISDLSYEGDIKPSSEKGIHAEAYKHRHDVNFVIHTHQINASIVSPLGFDIFDISPESTEIIGGYVPVAAYGLPGTGKLRKGVVAAIERAPESKAVIMAHHGALCMGSDYDNAFAVASELEKVCMNYVLKKYERVTGTVAESFASVGELIASRKSSGPNAPELTPYDSERNGDEMTLYKAKDEEPVAKIRVGSGMILGEGEIPPEAAMHRAIYMKRKDINSIVHSVDRDIKTISTFNMSLKPLLDDCAQIAGATVKTAFFSPDNAAADAQKVVKKMRSRSAVMLKDNGALCCGPSRYDAQATEMVMDKGCKAYLGAALFNKIKPINPIETRLMRFIYVTKYSKKAGK